ncbi:hypothetical protein SDC9_142151 [bioreactor metagenome]|uniref:Uncharacterized protein n=1 Tax=bioreactor metagenome TaxID=1076179 RepID=A0A645E361_9ZZZZ
MHGSVGVKFRCLRNLTGRVRAWCKTVAPGMGRSPSRRSIHGLGRPFCLTDGIIRRISGAGQAECKLRLPVCGEPDRHVFRSGRGRGGGGVSPAPAIFESPCGKNAGKINYFFLFHLTLCSRYVIINHENSFLEIESDLNHDIERDCRGVECFAFHDQPCAERLQ